MADYIMTDIQVIGAGGDFDVRPAVGEEWEVTYIGSDAWVGVPPASVPDVNAGIFDGTLGPAWVLATLAVRGWNRRQKLFLNRTDYLRLNNPGGAGANVSFSAKVVRAFGVAASFVVTDLDQLAAAATWEVQPPVGYEYHITDVGSSQWIGAGAAALPDLQVSLYDGTLEAIIMNGADTRGWDKNLDIYINNTDYFRLTNTNVAQADVCIVGKIARFFGTGASVVRSEIQTIAAGGAIVWDIQPPAGEEWRVTEIAADTWVGVNPAGLPLLTVSMFDGANLSDLLISTDSKGWLGDIDILIDNQNYLRIIDPTSAGLVAGISAVLTRQYTV